MSELVKELTSSEEYKTFIQDLLKEAIKDELKCLHKEIATLNEKVVNLNDELEHLKGDNHTLKCDRDTLVEANTKLDLLLKATVHDQLKHCERIDELEQYSRRNCLLVTGVQEEIGENTDETIMKIAKEKMNMDIEPRDLDRSHRVGKPKDGKKRPIVVKFARYNDRHRFIKARKGLKGTRIGVQDLLSPTYADLFKEAKILMDSMRDLKAVWTWDGKVMVQVLFVDNKTRNFHVKNKQHLKDIFHHGYPGPELEPVPRKPKDRMPVPED